jgi:hypothetical protein
MNIEEIAKRIENPNLCVSQDISALNDLTKKYPYAQTFSILYLKALSANNDIRFDEELLKHAYKITDKAKIYDLVNEKVAAESIETPIAPEIIIEENTESHVISDTPQQIDEPINIEPLALEKEEPIIEEKVETESIVELEETTEVEEETLAIPIQPEEITETEIVSETLPSEDEIVENETETITDITSSEEKIKIDPSETEVEVENIDAIDIIINDEEKIVEFNLQETEVIVESVSLDEKLYLEAFDHTEQEIEEDLTLEKEVIIHAFSSIYSPLDNLEPEVESENETKVEEVISENNIVEETKTIEEETTVKSDVKENSDSTQKRKAFSSWLKANKTTQAIKVEQTQEEGISELKIPEEKTIIQPKENTLSSLNKTEEIVNNFLINQPSISKLEKESEQEERPKKEFYSPIKIAKQSLDETTLPVSETLGKIFAAQGNFPKAIYVYSRLMLIYPEKKIFFANKIEELEQKLNK